MSSKIANQAYLDKAELMDEAEAERTLSRMAGKLPRRLEKDKLTRIEAIAIQLEIEDEQLEEWRERVAEVRQKEKKRDEEVKEKTAKKEGK